MKKILTSLLPVAMSLIALQSFGQQGPIKAGEDIAVTSTKYGKVRGYIDDGIYAFKGIPYAKAERFMPAETPDKWDDVRQCTIYGPQVMQGKSQSWRGQSDDRFGFEFVVEPMDEKESLVLNVWSKGINDGKKRPVWVWIHGGGFSGGSANQLPFFDGRSLAAKGDIVVVTLNHRLNILGYMDLRGLGGKYSESVNLGQRDLIAALKWVKDNIANFGGDPNMVTIDGQSGGGAKVTTLMAMPEAAGLFQRAIVQSGSILKVGTGEVSKQFGLDFAKELGVTPENPEKLNDFTYEELVDASRKAMSSFTGDVPFMMSPSQSPTVDGKHIVQHPFDPTPTDFSKDVAMLIGSNRNEFGYTNRKLITPLTMAEVKATLTDRYGAENAEKYIAAYQEAYPNENRPQNILTTTVRTTALKQASIKQAQGGAPAYVYLFEWQSPVNDGSLGAAHGMELPFMFNNIAMARTLTGGGKDAYALADKISSAWINFVKTGDPNCKELPKWEPYTPTKGATMVFDNTCKVKYNFDQELINLGNTLPPTIFR
ncbi:carboxylesterase/lipase family protein [Flagellimonas sp. GZD32]|uniref:carboxylesterase/lipase family protein n=1 Tax=Flagellimonas cixiensis TaxID=3228750 RepID=UPI0035C8C1BA